MFTRNFDKAREAYKKRSIEKTKLAHLGAGTAEDHRQEQGQYR